MRRTSAIKLYLNPCLFQFFRTRYRGSASIDAPNDTYNHTFTTVWTDLTFLFLSSQLLIDFFQTHILIHKNPQPKSWCFLYVAVLVPQSRDFPFGCRKSTVERLWRNQASEWIVFKSCERDGSWKFWKCLLEHSHQNSNWSALAASVLFGEKHRLAGQPGQPRIS